MKDRDSNIPLARCRLQARRLLRQFRSENAVEASAAAERLMQLRSISPEQVRLKHALAVIAREHGYESWIALKANFELDLWYEPKMDACLNRWFKTYEQARKSREDEGGFLLPYRQHFFVCESAAIRALGLDPEDPDWKNIEFNCVQPKDQQAYVRLCEKRKEATSEGNRAKHKWRS